MSLLGVMPDGHRIAGALFVYPSRALARPSYVLAVIVTLAVRSQRRISSFPLDGISVSWLVLNPIVLT